MKKIVIVTHRFYPIIGGAENQALLLAKQLVSRGNEVCVLTGRLGNTPQKEIIDGLSIVRLNKYSIEKNFYLFILLFNLRLLLYLLFRLRKFDKVLYFFGADLFAVSAFPLKWVGKKTMIRTATPAAGEVGGNYKNAKFYHVRKYLLAAFDKFIAITTEIKSNLLAESIASNRILRMNNGVDTKLFYSIGNTERIQLRKKLGLAKEKIYLLFCGHFYKAKGLDFLISSLIDVGKSQHYSNVELLVLGGSQSIAAKSSFEADIMGMIQQHNLPVSINFLGQVFDRGKYFQAADIFVLPSQSEGMPNALLEAMACGLACVATNVGGVSDVIRDGTNGIIVKYGDNQELGNAIRTLVRDDDLRKNIGEQAHALIKTDYAIEVVAKEYEAIFKNVL